ncbi:hypothetical protein XENTR_v10005801 [Xenopus tropicalis]|nr:hypothetical protein XENTR_v10005801 [Xenopus tropicalis]
MGLEEELLKIGRRLERRFSEANTDHILELLKELQAFEVTVPLLRSTRIGVTVNKIKKKSDERKVTELAKAIIKDWKKILESSYKDKGTKATADLVKPTQSDSVRISSPAFKNLHLERPRSYSADIQPFIQTEKKKERSHSTTIQPSLHIVKKRERTHSTSDKSSFHATKKPERVHSTDVQSSSHNTNKLERNHSTDDKSLCHTSKKPERSHSTDVQSPLDAAKKTERNHCSDAQTSVQTTKKPERRHSLSSPLPSPTSCKSPTNTKEESRKPSASSPVQPTRNGSTKPITDAGKEGASGGQMGSPADVHSQSPCLLSPCYLTGDPVRDKCVDMVASALKTDDDYKQFGTNCERLAWEIEECIYRDIKATDMKYRNRIRSRISNLKDPKNPNLRKNVLCGVVTPQNIATMTAEEMASDELRELRNTMTQEAIREHQMAKTGGTTTDLLQCEKCKKKNCTYNQVQTRSADEPMTTFVLCNECGNRWKFC